MFEFIRTVILFYTVSDRGTDNDEAYAVDGSSFTYRAVIIHGGNVKYIAVSLIAAVPAVLQCVLTAESHVYRP